MAPVVLITGCSEGGIGFALAEQFSACGCTTYATARSADKMAALSPSVRRLAMDVTKDDSITEAVGAVLKEMGRIDILVNNAGIARYGPVLDVPMSSVEDAYQTNVFGILRCCKAVAPHMAARRSGLVINISSVAGTFPTPWAGIYGSSKSAVNSLTQALAMELAPFSIKVVLVAPGAVRSRISASAAEAFDLPEDSLFTSWAANIAARTQLSQNARTMPAEEFARRLVDIALSRRPPFFASFAPLAGRYKLFSWLPTAWVRFIFTRMFMKLPEDDKSE